MSRFLLSFLFVSALFATPESPVVVSGDVSFANSAQALEVTASDRAIIEWQRFSIDAAETVRFLQPSETAVMLNRVTGTDVSTLSGMLQSNGIVYLINPRGVIVGAGAVVDTAGFLATTLDVENGEFLAGGDALFTGSSDAAVVQLGTIRAHDGDIVLMAHLVRHEGKLEAHNGSVALVAGHEVLVKPAGMPLLTIRPDLRASGIENLGSIEALNAYVLSDGVSPLLALRQEGEISLVQEGGKMVLSSRASGATIGQKAALSAPNGNISVSTASDILFNLGSLDASGTSGGTIDVSAPVFINTGTLQADGSVGSGGTISVTADTTFAETVFGHSSVQGTTPGGTISVSAPSLFSSGTYEAPAGQVRLTGSKVTLIAAEISGNEIVLGGTNAQAQAEEVYMSPATTLSGNQIQIWAEETLHDFGAGAGVFPTITLVDPLASSGGTATFGNSVAVLSNGNIVVTKPGDDTGQTNRGAAFLYNGFTGALISTLTGTSANDQVGSGGITPLTGSSNYLIQSSSWTNTGTGAAGAGAVTWANGTTGISGSVDATNSLVGTTLNDGVGIPVALTNGHYAVRTLNWDRVDGGSLANVGAVTWGNGTTGITGTVSITNSIIGSTATDQVGSAGTTALTNGNYVIRSPNWDRVDGGALANVGAATWGNGTTGITGTVSIANSLIGSTASDQVSSSSITAVTNGNYVVTSSSWDRVDGGALANVGAATWGNGTTGITGTVSIANSLIGSTINDQVSTGNIVPLTNGHYVVRSTVWNRVDGGALALVGAVTWGNGTTGITGTVSIANSLIGSTGSDSIGSSGITALTNGNYVVRSPLWDRVDGGALADVGAATWGTGTTGITGTVSITNSLIGSTASDQVSSNGTTALTNGHYLVSSRLWDRVDGGALADVGAATWGNGTTGITGTVSIANSLIGSTTNDQVSASTPRALTNGHYVVCSSIWDRVDGGAVANVGAATWGNGTTGITGTVSIANSLIGSTASDQVSNAGFMTLTNGHYVVSSDLWDRVDGGALVDVGAATWGNGTTGITGTVSITNSLIGSTASDSLANGGITAQGDGNYIVISSLWDQVDGGALVDAGAATWGNGTTGITGTVTSANSVIGTTASSGLTAAIDNPAVPGTSVPHTFVVRFLNTPAVLIAGDPLLPSPTPASTTIPSSATLAFARIQFSRAIAESFSDWNTRLFGPYLSDDPWAPIYTAKGLLINLPSLVLNDPWEPPALLRAK